MAETSIEASIRRVLEDPRSRYFSLVNDTLAAATLVSILAIVLETVPSLDTYRWLFIAIEWVTVIIFTLEYAARFHIAEPKRTYALSFFGIVDLVAILPTFLGLGNFTFFKSARIVRVIRFLRMVRLAKIARVKAKDVEESLGVLGFNVALYAATLLFFAIVTGTLLHLLIHGEGSYWSIPSGMYWAFAVFLGGIPAAIPNGAWGATIFVLAKFSGMVLFGLLIRLVGEIFNKVVLGKKK